MAIITKEEFEQGLKDYADIERRIQQRNAADAQRGSSRAALACSADSQSKEISSKCSNSSKS